MKHRYIDTLLSEIQLLESKVANLKKSQHVSFSFFKESFKRTQEISRLLHELEFVQIEDMKSQMERLVQFLSEAQEAKEEVEIVPVHSKDDGKSTADTIDEMTPNEAPPTPIVEPKEEVEAEKVAEEVKEVEIETVLSQDESKNHTPQTTTQAPTLVSPVASPIHQSTPPPSPTHSIINKQKGTIVENLGVKNRSLNDVQPVNQTIQDAKRSISLNDRFLFQRELFDNNRETMNTMMSNLQPFTSFDAIEHYLKENTNWNFKDETVDKFMQMLKDSFR